MIVFIVEVSASPFLSPKNPFMGELFRALPAITQKLEALPIPGRKVSVNVRFRPTQDGEVNPPALAIHVKAPSRLKNSKPQTSPAERMNEALQGVLFPEGKEGERTRKFWREMLCQEERPVYVWIEGLDQNAEAQVYYHPIDVPSS